MSLTIGKLKEIIKDIPNDAIVTNDQNEDFIHLHVSDVLIISTTKPIGYCKRSGEYVYPSKLKDKGYSAYSPALDEDLYNFEWIPLSEKK